MSIKGFSVGGNVERYDYNFLDNRPSEITVDTALSDSSTNPVQNSAVTNAINAANGSISSVSGEVDDLKSAMNHFRKWSGKNYLDTSNIVKGYTINSSGGLNASGNGAESTLNFIPIPPSTTFISSVNGVGNISKSSLLIVAFYSSASESSFISRVVAVQTFTSPANAAYMRVSKYLAIDDSGFQGKDQIEVGSSVTGYEPYYTLNNELVDYSSLTNVPKVRMADLSTAAKAWSELKDVGTPSDGYYEPVNYTFVSAVGQTTIETDVVEGDVFEFTGKVLGSIGYPYAIYWGTNNTVLGIAGRSSSTAQQFTNLVLNPPLGTVKVSVTAFTNNGDPISLKKYVYKGEDAPSKSTSMPSSDRFVGHNPLPYFDTDYCHIICYGQSLSNGSDSLYVTDPTLDDCYMLGALATPSAQLNPLTLTSGNQHPVVSAVNSLHELLANNCMKVPALIAGSYGAGGQSIAQLMSSTRQAEIKAEEGYTYDISTSGRYQVFLNSLTYAKQVADADGKTISCPIIYYLQGERDYYTDEELSTQPGSVVAAYACGGDKDKYKLYMSRLKSDMQNACMTAYGQTVKPLFAIYQVSGGFVKNHTMSINMAQIEFADENDDVILLPSPYFVPNYSSSHLTTNGYRWYGEFMAKAAFQTLAMRSDYEPMCLSDARIDGNNIRLKVRHANLPLKIDTYTVEQAGGKGFAVWADDVVYTVQGVEFFGDEVIVKTGINLANKSKVEISYAGMEVNGTGNVRDSSPYVALYNYWDDSNDKGQSGNLTISHIPTDEDGNSIRGKKYPMYNWMSSFYQRIV